MKTILKFSILCALLAVISACSRNPMQQRSEKTGFEYNRPDMGYFNAKTTYAGKTPIGMVYVPVNSYVKGQNANNLSSNHNNTKHRSAVHGFYMDMYEVTNLNWREYVSWVSQVYKHFPLRVVKTIPDETVWRSELAYNEPYLRNYYSHVAYSFYPVVGVSWNQAQDYCKWRTDRINELMLIASQIIIPKPLSIVAKELKATPKDENVIVFTTKHARDYVANANKLSEEDGGDDEYGDDEYGDDEYGDEEYDDEYDDEYEDYDDEDYDEEGEAEEEDEPLTEIEMNYYAQLDAVQMSYNRAVDIDADGQISAKEWNDAIDGVLFDGMCRLPTESEWEYAAYSLEKQDNGLYMETKSYPWSGDQMRHFEHPGGVVPTTFFANFMRGRGDLIGQSVNHTLTVPVTFFYPNTFGLYNMAGNVNEWVLDVYRATEGQNAEINTFRGNEFEDDSTYAESVLLKHFPEIANIKAEDRDSMRNMLLKDNKISFSGGDFRDFKDGDQLSSINDKVLEYDEMPTGIEKANMISNTSRVYKGGSWKDRAVWLNPGNRRHMEQSKCTNDIGFRCVMSIVGGKEHYRQ